MTRLSNQQPRRQRRHIFKGEGTLPLYVGKSVDIRSRVLAHLRAEDEVEMVAQSRRVDFIETAGEIGALLLEAQLIKRLNPLYNVRLRRLRQLCSIRLSEKPEGITPEVVSGKAVVVEQAQDLYGLFGSVHAAQNKLRELADPAYPDREAAFTLAETLGRAGWSWACWAWAWRRPWSSS